VIWRTALGFPADVTLEESHLPAGLALFVARRNVRPDRRALLGLGARLWRERAAERETKEAEEKEKEKEESPPGPRPRDAEEAARMFESEICWASHLVRRGRWLGALSESSLRWQPRDGPARRLCIEGGLAVTQPAGPRVRPRLERLRCFDAATYDRLRVLTTELRRLVAEGKELELRLGPYVTLDRVALARRLFWV
jgi:hypothetical protein